MSIILVWCEYIIIMLQCSICKNTPTRQCTSCNRIFFCNICSYAHLEDHIEKKTICTFEKIQFKLSNKDFRSLEQFINSANKDIDNQKKDIIKETLKAISQIKKCMMQAFEILEKMRCEYNNFRGKRFFDEIEFSKAKEILRKNLKFNYPYFTQVEGQLTKNLKFSIAA